MSLSTSAVKAIIVNAENKVLFVKRTVRENDVCNWDLPGGLVEDYENKEAALLRELKEELGLAATIRFQSTSWRFLRPKDGQQVSAQNYVCDLPSDGIVLSKEHSEYAWVTLDELENLELKDPSLKEALRNTTQLFQ